MNESPLDASRNSFPVAKCNSRLQLPTSLDDVCVLAEALVLMREPRAKNESDLLGESKKHEKKVHCSDESAWEIWP